MSGNDFSSPPTAPAPDPAAAPQAPAGGTSAHAAQQGSGAFLDARRLAWALGIAGGFVLVLLGATYGTYLWHFNGPASADPGVWGQFGDFVGGVINPIVGLLTLLGLAVTVALQMRQLELSRQALANAQHELRQADAERQRTATYQALHAGIQALAPRGDSDEWQQALVALSRISGLDSNANLAERWRTHLLHQLLQLVDSEVPRPDAPHHTPLVDVLRKRT